MHGVSSTWSIDTHNLAAEVVHEVHLVDVSEVGLRSFFEQMGNLVAKAKLEFWRDAKDVDGPHQRSR